MPRESLDAPEDLPKQARRQVALGQLEHEGPGMSDEAAAGLEQPLLEARQGPALEGEGQDKPAQEIAEGRQLKSESLETGRRTSEYIRYHRAH